MLQTLPFRQIKIDEPAMIEIHGSITIYVDANKNIFIDGHDKVYVRSQDELNLDSKNINITASETVYIGAEKIEQQAERIDLNKHLDKNGYRK